MDEISSRIVRAVSNLNLYREFSPTILKRGDINYQNGTVHDVQLVSDNEITATVIGSLEYKTTIKTDAFGKIQMTCTCQYQGSCKHLAALVFYIRRHESLFDLQSRIAKADDQYTLAQYLYQKLNNIGKQYWVLTDPEMIQMLVKGILQTIPDLVKTSNESGKYRLFMKIFCYLLISSSEYFLHPEETKILTDAFTSLISHPSPDFLSIWQEVIRQVSPDSFLEYIEPCVLSVKSRDQALLLEAFLETTITNVEAKKVAGNGKNNEEYFQDLATTLIYYRLHCLELIDPKAYREYYEEKAVKYEAVEIALLSELYKSGNEAAILDYTKKHSGTRSTGTIMSLGILRKQNAVNDEEYSRKIIDLFKNDCRLTDFKTIIDVTPPLLFLEMKENLLKYAKKKDRFQYLEMEILSDKETGYEKAKEAGILEFDRHATHFLPEKEEELVLYYQEQLAQIFSRYRGMCGKIYEALRAIERLISIKGGRYYALSVYRLARKQIGQYEASSALDALHQQLLRYDL